MKGYEKDDKGTFRLPRQHLPQSHGAKRHDPPDKTKQPRAAFLYFLRGNQHGGNRQFATLRYSEETAGSWYFGGSPQGGADDKTGL